MAKKSKDKDKSRRPVRQIQFEDKTAERQFSTQMAKAEKLYEAAKYSEAVETLEPLLGRFSDRLKLLELLGISYASSNLLTEAREMFERALALTPSNAGFLTRFNLAQLYVLTGFTFLAYEQSQLMDCYQLARETGQDANLERCRQFREDCNELAEKVAADNGKPLREFLDFALTLDYGRLAMSKQELAIAESHFTKAAQLDPTSPVPLNNLALVYLLQNQLDNAVNSSRYVVEKLDGQNRNALVNLVRLMVIQDERTEAEGYLSQLLALPAPDGPDEILKVAEAYAALEDDRAVYGLLESFYAQPEKLTDLDSAAYEEAITFAVVAAANLGYTRQSLMILRQTRPFTRPTLLERTLFALENNERGPRVGGRFFYYDPVTAFPPAAAYFEDLLTNLDEEDTTDYRAGLQKFFEEYGESALEIAAYKYWIDRDPDVVADLLAQALASKVAGAEETLRRLAFTRAGDDLQRVTAARVLIEAGFIEPQERLKIWLGQRQLIGPLAELSLRQKAIAEQEQNPQNAKKGYDHKIANMLNEALDLMRQGQRDEAIRKYQQILEQNPNVKQAYQNLAALLSGKGDLEGAIEYLQQALKVDPDYVYAQIALAQLWVGAGKLTEAHAQLESLRPRLSSYYVDELEAFYAAKIALYRKQERFDEMKAAMRELLEIDPQNDWASDLLSQFETTSQEVTPPLKAEGEE